MRNKKVSSVAQTPSASVAEPKNTEITDLESLKGRNSLMRKFRNSAMGFGISPQSIFRIADFSYKGYIETEYFIKILSKINLNLSPLEISHLVYIFDEQCTGFINKDDFMDSLDAYAISCE